MSKINCEAANPATCRYHGKPLQKLEKELAQYAKTTNVVQYLKTKSAIATLKKSTDEEITQQHINKVFNNPDQTGLGGQTLEIVNTADKSQTTIRIAKRNETPLRCKLCSKPLHKRVIEKLNSTTSNMPDVECPRCGCGMNWGGGTPPYIVDIDYNEAQKFILDKENVLETKWYHITSKENWHEEAKEAQVYVHLGSKAAALDRLSILQERSYGGEFYLHEVEFTPTAEVSDNVFSDENEWPAKIGDKKAGMKASQVHRYVNTWEEPGSISLIVNPNLFTLTKTEEIDEY